MEPGANSAAAAATEAGRAGGMSEEARALAAEAEEEALAERAKQLIAKISAAQAKPNPRHLHALASMLEDQESRYVQESGVSSVNNNRTSHTIGKLGSLVRDNDEFYELISSKFLSESRYSVAVRSAAARVLLSFSSTSTFPHIFDDTVLDNIKTWVMEDTVKDSGNECDWKHEFGVNKPTDSEMLKTYACGLLALSLAGGTHVVEDILASGLSAKLMRYLRTRILGESNANQKDACFLVDNKHATPVSSVRGREESRGRSRQVLDSSRLDGLRPGHEGLLGDQSAEKDHDRNGSVRQAHEEECWGDGDDLLKSEISDSAPDGVDMYEMVKENADLTRDGLHNKDLVDGRVRYGERHATGKSSLDEDADENLRDDPSRRRAIRLFRTRGKGRNSDNPLENERILMSPPGLRLGGTNRGSRDRNQLKNDETRKFMDTKKNSENMDSGDSTIVEDNDERFRECTIGSKDISEIVKKATRAAESEARAAGAPTEAIKAAGDAAAELVKGAAFEALKSTNDEEEAVLAASTAASTVVDAAMATEMSWNSSKMNMDLVDSKLVESEIEEKQDFFILDDEPLSRLREKYCIQCLEILGEYVEALGPVLHEKGVDVCLAMLQRSLKDEGATDQLAFLPEVLKLICALASHRKFAALFVDRGGVQKLLSVQRVLQTFFSLSSCLFTIGSLQGIMERVCALPSDVVYQVVELALQLLECPQDQARKNAAIFFSGAFVFRAILDSFDAQDGLQKMLDVLHGAASVRSGGNSGALGIPNGTLRNERSPAEVLTASEKQIAYHTCVALRQYFRAHLLLLVDSLRPNKSNRSIARSTSSARAAYKPLDISNEAMDAVLHQIQRDRKLGAAFVRARWPVVDKFLASNGHITMLELCQAPPVERYLHDLAQYALGVLHVVTFVYYSRKKIVNATLSNDRVGMAVILDAANCSGYVDPEVIHPALNVLVNLVCPPPSISNKPTVSQGQQSALSLNWNATENKDKQSERSISDHTVPLNIQNETRENNGDANLVERPAPVAPFSASNPQATTPAPSSGVVGDRRISLGPGAGCAGLAAQLEQEYRQAREAVRANNGIKVLLHLLHPRMITPPPSLDCLRALACRVLLGLARDETIAHILTKLQVGKKLSELIRDSGTQISGAEQGRWQSELAQVAIELIAIVTNAGRASTLAATDAAAPTLRRIERAAIAAATPITYHSRELLLLIHEHLQASGLAATAALLQKEADLTPLPPLVGPQLPLHQTSVQETSSVQLQWPSGRIACGFLLDKTKTAQRDDDVGRKSDATYTSRKKPLVFASNFLPAKSELQLTSSVNYSNSALKSPPAAPNDGSEISSPFCIKSNADMETPLKTPLLLPMKRKLVELKDPCSLPAKRFATAEPVSESPVFQTPNTGRRSFLPVDSTWLNPAATTPRDPFGRATSSNYNSDDLQCQTPGAQLTLSQHGYSADQQTANAERMTLDSLVVQYLKHQHRQCPAPITTLPSLSLLHPHVCPEPSRSLDAPANVTARVSTREFRKQYGGIHAHRRNRQFVYSRFRPCRVCRDDTALLTSISFLGDTFRVATGSHAGELKIFDLNNGNVLESHACHQTPISLVQSAYSARSQMILSSASHDVKLWDATSISGGPLHPFDGCKAARFSQSGTMFAALSTEPSRREVLLYDIQTCNVELRLSESSNGPSGPVRGHGQSLIHFSPLDTMLLWNGILWDRRSSGPIHRFDQFTDYGGGGFHPAGNEVILNSEVWDLRKFKLLRSVPSLDQTVITFNGGGDVIYAILRRNFEDITSAVNTRRARHPLFPAFRTIDAVNYSDIATVPVGRCVLDFAADPTDSYVGVVAMDDNEEMFSSARLYEIGRRRPTDDDSDPDDGLDTDDDEDDEDNDESDADGDPILGGSLDGDGDSDSDMGNEDDDEDDVDDLDSGDDLDEDADFNIDDVDFDGGQGIFEIMAEGEDGDEDDSEVVESYSSEDEGDFR
ncbi:DDB1- and CUL4-associated factor-like protein 1 [Iris pallida]|uniref:DDB1- and CUL4-associated factor-like protein 1 n=1 Tax=Iris pallida TaxID=29817 RepID=A0AAX6E2W6_IRIPA|nr:DDB1- and CUL4-associated factor-like protein 1 [Iris pallida]